MALEHCKLLDKTRRISPIENSSLNMTHIIPLVQLTTLAKLNAHDCLCSLISERRALPVTATDHPSVSVLRTAHQESPLCILKKRLNHLLKVCNKCANSITRVEDGYFSTRARNEIFIITGCGYYFL